MPQLDALRAIAVGLVMLHHYYGGFLTRFIPVGGYGVEIFFVLSGFLITGILLKGTETVGFIERFYVRRALRLLPLYYAVVLVLLLTNADVRQSWPYYVFHGVNFCLVAQQRWCPATHFWSLAVEEQFYLLWPWIVLGLSRRRLVAVCIGLIVAAPIIRTGIYLLGDNNFAAVYLLPDNVDALATGALLAAVPATMNRVLRPWIVLLSAAVAVVSFAVMHRLVASPWLPPMAVESVILPCFCSIVAGAARGFSGPGGWLLNNPALRYLGRISYGIYVIHLFVPGLLGPWGIGVAPYRRAAVYGAVSIALATASWFCLEQPFNRLKDRYRKVARNLPGTPT